MVSTATLFLNIATFRPFFQIFEQFLRSGAFIVEESEKFDTFCLITICGFKNSQYHIANAPLLFRYFPFYGK